MSTVSCQQFSSPIPARSRSRPAFAGQLVGVLVVGQPEDRLLPSPQRRPELRLLAHQTLAMSDVHAARHDAERADLRMLLRLRENRTTTDTPVIIVTADASPETAVTFRRLGANDLVGKPYRIQQLRTAINTVMGSGARSAAVASAASSRQLRSGRFGG